MKQETAEVKPEAEERRTLPREIIKWIQGLDLSYPVKDYRKDLANGFLVAEIFLRYYPKKLQMHSFENSSRLERRKNNWELLERFFEKNKLPIVRKDWADIMNEGSAECLYNFMLKCYPILTQRKIPPPVQPPQVAVGGSKESTVSYILREKGLERLEPSKLSQGRREPETEKFEDLKYKETTSKKKNIMSMSYKPISPNLQNLDYQIDVKNVNVRPIGERVKTRVIEQDSTKKNPQAKEDRKNVELDSKKRIVDKSVSLLVGEILQNLASLGGHEQEAATFRKLPGSSEFQVFMTSAEQFGEGFQLAFFNAIFDSKDTLLNFITKDNHETWRFFLFMLACMEKVDCRGEAFRALVAVLRAFSQGVAEKDALHTKHLFVDYLLSSITDQIKTSVYFQKKMELFRLVYCFYGPDVGAKTQAIVQLKQQLQHHMEFFVQGLAVLIREEKVYSEENKKFFEEFIFYANINLFAQSPNLRTMALAMYIHLADLNYELVARLLQKKVGRLASADWWENRCQVVILLSKLVRSVLKSQKYVSLVKNQNNFHKFFSLQNEKIINEIKESLEVFARGIVAVVSRDESAIISQIFFVNCLDIVSVTRAFTDFFIAMLIGASPEMRRWILNSHEEGSDEEYLFLSDKSLKYTLRLNSTSLEQETTEILLRLTEMIRDSRLEKLNQPYMDVLIFCFKFIDFKMVNMESCENIASSLCPLVYLALCDPLLAPDAVLILEKLLNLYFYSEIRIKDNEELFSAVICLSLQNANAEALQAVERVLKGLLAEAGNSSIKKFLLDIRGLVSGKVGKQDLPRVARLFEGLDSSYN